MSALGEQGCYRVCACDGFGAYQSLGQGILYTILTVLICVCVSMCMFMQVCKCDREREKMCIDTLFRKKASDPLKLEIYIYIYILSNRDLRSSLPQYKQSERFIPTTLPHGTQCVDGWGDSLPGPREEDTEYVVIGRGTG